MSKKKIISERSEKGKEPLPAVYWILYFEEKSLETG